MNVKKNAEGNFEIEIDIKQGTSFADAVIPHADEMRSPVIELANLLRTAQYNAENDFRQPPHAFDEKAPRAPSTQT